MRSQVILVDIETHCSYLRSLQQSIARIIMDLGMDIERRQSEGDISRRRVNRGAFTARERVKRESDRDRDCDRDCDRNRECVRDYNHDHDQSHDRGWGREYDLSGRWGPSSVYVCGEGGSVRLKDDKRERIVKGDSEGGEGEGDVEANLRLLFLAQMTHTIYAHPTAVPVPLRAVLRTLRMCVEQCGCGDGDIAVGGFFSLRVIIPAVLMPHCIGPARKGVFV